MSAQTTRQRMHGSPAVTLFALMMLAHTLSDGIADLARASTLHGVGILFGGAAIAAGWFRGHRAWLFLYVPMAVALALLGAPEPRTGRAHMKVDLIVAYSVLAAAGLLRFLPRAPWLRPARA